MADTKTVRFLKDHDQYRSEQDATLPAADADRLIADGVAVATDQATDAAGSANRPASASGSTPASGAGSAERDMTKPGWSNSPPAEQQDGVKGQAARAPGGEKPKR